MSKLSCLVVFVGLFIASSSGQWPLGQSFFSGMNQMTSGMNNMAANMRIMGEQMALQRQTMIEDDMRRSWEGVPFVNGGSVFVSANGGLGYAHNSTDGSFTLYALGSTSPPTGYMYHLSAQGGTSFQSW